MLRKAFGLSLAFAVVTATPSLAQLPGIEIELYVGGPHGRCCEID
jgi:hypothetical protein